MKKWVFLLLALSITANLSAQEIFILPDLQKPHQIAVDGNDLFIFDEADYSLHVYSISPFALKLKIGQKGDGPHDFKYLPFVYVQPEALVCTDFTKTVWFSKKGEVLKVKEYAEFSDFDLNSEMLLFPIKEHFLRITADHGLDKRHVYLLDSRFKKIKELYEGPFVWQTGAPIHYRTDTFTYKDLIFIADTQKGFHFEVFDAEGNHIRTIDKSLDVEKIPDQPLLHQYCVSEDKIYATTYKRKGSKTEMIILDLKGRILQRLYLPLASIKPKRGVVRYDPYVVDQEKLYELNKNSETGKWELLITGLEQDDFPVLQGPYFGQNPPGMKPEIFAPDESFLIFDTQRSDSEWNSDENLFICFRMRDGSWSQAFDLGSKLNLPGGKMLATISQDSKYLFFCNRGDIYWIDARIIEELKPKELK